MLESQDMSEHHSGYLKLNDQLQVEESAGQISQVLRLIEIPVGKEIAGMISGLKKNLRYFFQHEVMPAIESRRIQHLHYERKNSKLSVAITPLSNGATVLSIDEAPLSDRLQEQTLSEKLNEVLIRVNPDMKIVYVSKNLRPNLKLKPADVAEKTIFESSVFQNQTELIAQSVSKVFRQQKSKEIEFELAADGKNRWWNAAFLPETDPASGQQTVLIILKNITPYKALERKLRESETRYEMATAAADLGIWDYITETGETFYSKRWKSMLGYYPDELPDNFSVWEQLLHPDDRDRMIRHMNNFINSDLLLYEAEFRLRHKSGNYIWIRSRATALRDQSGKILRIMGTHHDISKEKKSENELKKLHQAIIQSPIMVVITDVDGFIEFCNPAFCKVTGWTDQEVIGKKPSILKSGYQQGSFYDKLWKTILAGNEWQGEFKNRKKNGEFYWELASISPIRNDFGNITHFVKIAENISYLKKIERDLKKAKQDAEVANNYKNNFLANMSHEIRTPINTIIGFSELIKNQNLAAEKRKKYTGIIEENSQALLRLIDDIIDLAKIEANELKIKKEACSLEELFSELEMTYSNFLKRREKSNLKLVFHIPEEAHHDVIFTDPYRLRQILNNLFINALRYTETGSIEVGYTIYNENKLRFFVSDTGPGIPAGKLKTVFKRFNDVGETPSGGSPASGLGLSICKDLTALLGGEISVKSVQGEGTIFFVTLPYDKIKIPLVRQATKQTTHGRYNFSDCTIMIAEDTPYNFEYLQSILTRTGANILWAKDGIDVLKMFNREKIDLILMDIQLPEISGYEATSQIRQKNKSVPIIAQTAYAMSEDKQKCLDVGCNDVLVKPIRMDDVLSTVAKYLNK